jgi:trimethylamine--corrinoid protein Co-methyltransferase
MVYLSLPDLRGFYNLPSRGTGGGTDSKIPDIQAGIEKAVTLITAAMASINFYIAV